MADEDETVTFRAAVRDVETLIKLVDRLEEGEKRTVVSAVKRQLLNLPLVRVQDRSVTRSDVLRELEELINLVEDYRCDEVMDLHDLERLFMDETRALMSEQRGAETFVLAAVSSYLDHSAPDIS